MNKDIKEALIEIVGQQNFTDLLIDLVSYSYDASDHDHRPDAPVSPHSFGPTTYQKMWPFQSPRCPIS